jgi:hypothetical protein
MKILFCENCGDLVIPNIQAYEPNWCRCQAACCWWIDPQKGSFACWSQFGERLVSILGINNMLLTEPFMVTENQSEFGCIQKTAIERMLLETPDSYLFKRVNSMIIRFRPGFTSETTFATPPPAR